MITVMNYVKNELSANVASDMGTIKMNWPTLFGISKLIYNSPIGEIQPSETNAIFL